MLLIACKSSAVEPAPEFRFSLGYLDKSVAPGENFYRYACGGWLRVNRIPPDKTAWGPWQMVEERVWLQLRAILEAPSGQAADLYASGIDMATRNRLGFAPIASELTRIAELPDKAALAPFLAGLHIGGLHVLFAPDVAPDAKHSAVYALDLWQSNDALGLPDRDYYLTKTLAKEREAYRGHLVKMLMLTGDAPKKAAQQAETILRLETALAKISRPREDLQDSLKNYQKMPVAELAKMAPDFAWTEYFQALGAGALEQVIVGQPEFLAGLGKLLKAEPLEAWKVYLRWHVISEAASYLHEAADREHFAFYGTKLNGQPEQAPLWRRVTRVTDDCLGEVLGKTYCEQHFPPASKARVEEMVGYFHAAFHDRLSNVAWMSEATRNKALGKLQRFFAKVGYPEKFRDYSAIEIRRDDYYGNADRSTRFEWQRKIVRLGQAVDRAEWFCSPPTVNAFFMPTQNSITLPAGILQPPMFDPALDDAVNYGNIGATIGHEMTHGFDSDGRQYDADGSLNDWWTAEDAKQFETRAQKIVEQFNGFTPYPKMHVNGKLTLAENIADLGGLLIAWDALQKALAADPAKRKAIDGFTPEQRFFISYAQSWCVLERSERVKQSLLTDEHAPAETRANGPLMHMPEFYEAFGVKKGDKMWLTVEKRALIW
jgi:putative endopeptidase